MSEDPYRPNSPLDALRAIKGYSTDELAVKIAQAALAQQPADRPAHTDRPKCTHTRLTADRCPICGPLDSDHRPITDGDTAAPDPAAGLRSQIERSNPALDRAISDLAGLRMRALRDTDQPAQGEAFQTRVWPWLIHCFGATIARDGRERNHRFLEEALELVQSTGCTASEAHQLVDYVFGRPVGEPHQETGGVMVTLAALCLAHDLDMHAAGEDELTRVWGKADKIRAKQATKPAHGPLPGPSEADQPAQGERQAVYLIRTENGLWRPNARGYTNNPAEAGRYTHEEAKRHTRGLGPEKQARIIHEDDLTPADKPTCCRATEAHTLERAAQAICPMCAAGGEPQKVGEPLCWCHVERGDGNGGWGCYTPCRADAIRNLRGDGGDT